MLVNDSDFDSLVPGLPLSRRTFVGASLATGFALAVRPAQGQSVIQTSAAGLAAGDISIKAPDGVPVRAYWVQPSGKGPFPTVLVISEIFGLHEYIRDTCRRLARQGYQAIAPNLFQRQGDPASVGSVAEILSTIVSRVPDGQVMTDLESKAQKQGFGVKTVQGMVQTFPILHGKPLSAEQFDVLDESTKKALQGAADRLTRQVEKAARPSYWSSRRCAFRKASCTASSAAAWLNP